MWRWPTNIGCKQEVGTSSENGVSRVSTVWENRFSLLLGWRFLAGCLCVCLGQVVAHSRSAFVPPSDVLASTRDLMIANRNWLLVVLMLHVLGAFLLLPEVVRASGQEVQRKRIWIAAIACVVLVILLGGFLAML